MIYNHKVNSNNSVLILVRPPAAKESRSQCISNDGKRTIAQVVCEEIQEYFFYYSNLETLITPLKLFLNAFKCG